MAYVSRRDTLEPAETAEKRMEQNAHPIPINMGILYDCIYGGSLAQSGKACDTRKFLPNEWQMHERPDSFPLVD